MNANKIIIYQLLPRLFTNTCSRNIYNGTTAGVTDLLAGIGQ